MMDNDVEVSHEGDRIIVRMKFETGVPVETMKRLQQQNGWDSGLIRTVDGLLEPVGRMVLKELEAYIHEELLRDNTLYGKK